MRVCMSDVSSQLNTEHNSIVVRTYVDFLGNLQKWTDCQSNKGPKKHPSGVCSRYHFHPEDTEQEVKRVFNAIISGKMPVQEAINTNMIFRHLERLYHNHVAINWDLSCQRDGHRKITRHHHTNKILTPLSLSVLLCLHIYYISFGNWRLSRRFPGAMLEKIHSEVWMTKIRTIVICPRRHTTNVIWSTCEKGNKI